MIMKRRNIVIVLVALILASTILEFKFGNYSLAPVQGNWENNDQILQVPSVYRLSKENLFSGDQIINEYIKIYTTLLFSFLALVYNTFPNIIFSYFLVFLSLKIVFIVSVFLLSNLLLKNHKQALMAASFLSFTHFMGADEIGLTEVVPKNFAFAFMPLIFYLFLKDRKKYSIPCFIFLGILSYFHIFSVIPVALLFLYSHLSKKEYRQLLISIAILVMFTAPFLVVTQQKAGQIDPEIRSAAPYANLVNGFFTVAKFAPIVIIGLLAVIRPKKLENIFPDLDGDKGLLSWFVIITIYSLLSLAGIFSTKILLLTLYRSFKYVIFFSFIFAAPFVFWLSKKKKVAGVLAFLVILLYFSSIYYSTLLNGLTKNQAAYSSEVNDVITLGNWIDKNIEKNETILAPPDWGVIRVWGKRPLVFADTDSYVVLFTPEKFPNKAVYKEIGLAYKNSDSQKLLEIAKQNSLKYIITYNLSIPLNEKFRAGNFKVYYLG